MYDSSTKKKKNIYICVDILGQTFLILRETTQLLGTLRINSSHC